MKRKRHLRNGSHATGVSPVDEADTHSDDIHTPLAKGPDVQRARDCLPAQRWWHSGCRDSEADRRWPSCWRKG